MVGLLNVQKKWALITVFPLLVTPNFLWVREVEGEEYHLEYSHTPVISVCRIYFWEISHPVLERSLNPSLSVWNLEMSTYKIPSSKTDVTKSSWWIEIRYFILTWIRNANSSHIRSEIMTNVIYTPIRGIGTAFAFTLIAVYLLQFFCNQRCEIVLINPNSLSPFCHKTFTSSINHRLSTTNWGSAIEITLYIWDMTFEQEKKTMTPMTLCLSESLRSGINWIKSQRAFQPFTSSIIEFLLGSGTWAEAEQRATSLCLAAYAFMLKTSTSIYFSTLWHDSCHRYRNHVRSNGNTKHQHLFQKLCKFPSIYLPPALPPIEDWLPNWFVSESKCETWSTFNTKMTNRVATGNG